jgi:hypothetical protein
LGEIDVRQAAKLTSPEFFDSYTELDENRVEIYRVDGGVKWEILRTTVSIQDNTKQ